MKALRFLPFTFLAGVDGFGMFAPYMAVSFMVLAVVRGVQRMQASADEPVFANPLDALSDPLPGVVAATVR